MITRRDLARALAAANVSDWSIVEHVQELGRHESARGVRRSERRTRASVVMHQDQPNGRGSVRLDVAAHDSARDLVEQGLRLANAAIGPAWRTPAPAAPAKVEVFDRTLERADLVAVAVEATRATRRSDATVDACLEIVREQVNVQSRAGLDATWTSSHVRADLLVVRGDHSLALARTARRLADLDLGRAIADATRDLAQLAAATPPKPGPCALVLGTEAMLHGDPDGLRAGVWSIFAAQADALLERQGLTRYRLGAPITPAAATAREPLTVTSDGALPFATLSAPIGDEGDSIRRFALVQRGVAAGLGLGSREAAMRGTEPNGGVRNLVVTAGTWTGERPTRRTVEIRRLRALVIDPYTGDASLEIALGLDHDDGGAARPFTGGTIRLDLVAALALARRSAATIRRGAYAGPAQILVDGVELTA